jgi:hypothetical protein
VPQIHDDGLQVPAHLQPNGVEGAAMTIFITSIFATVHRIIYTINTFPFSVSAVSVVAVEHLEGERAAVRRPALVAHHALRAQRVQQGEESDVVAREERQAVAGATRRRSGRWRRER